MEVRGHDSSASLKRLLLLLCSRLFLFAFFQGAAALVLSSWIETEKYWMLIASITNIASVGLLVIYYRDEGVEYISTLRFDRELFRRDLITSAGLFLVSIPVVLVPSYALSLWLWGDTTYYHGVLFQQLPLYLTYLLLVIFPLSIAFAELPMYFGFIMPRLSKRLRSKFWALLLPVALLSIQHCTLPLVFDLKFIVFRGLMYLPFALVLGIALYKRPSLLPFLAIQHGILDALAVSMYFR